MRVPAAVPLARTTGRNLTPSLLRLRPRRRAGRVGPGEEEEEGDGGVAAEGDGLRLARPSAPRRAPVRGGGGVARGL